MLLIASIPANNATETSENSVQLSALLTPVDIGRWVNKPDI